MTKQHSMTWQQSTCIKIKRSQPLLPRPYDRTRDKTTINEDRVDPIRKRTLLLHQLLHLWAVPTSSAAAAAREIFKQVPFRFIHFRTRSTPSPACKKAAHHLQQVLWVSLNNNSILIFATDDIQCNYNIIFASLSTKRTNEPTSQPADHQVDNLAPPQPPPPHAPRDLDGILLGNWWTRADEMNLWSDDREMDLLTKAAQCRWAEWMTGAINRHFNDDREDPPVQCPPLHSQQWWWKLDLKCAESGVCH